MAKKKKVTTGIIGTPPPGEERVTLHLQIDKGLAWRMKMFMLVSESEGVRTSKRAFVENAIVKALDQFDAKRSR